MNKYAIFIGRFDPFHIGHKKLIEESNKKNILILLRDCKSKFTLKERKKIIELSLKDKFNLKIICIPDIDGVYYGRDVGYNIIELYLNEEIKKVSGTKIRNNIKKNNYIGLCNEAIEYIKGLNK